MKIAIAYNLQVVFKHCKFEVVLEMFGLGKIYLGNCEENYTFYIELVVTFD